MTTPETLTEQEALQYLFDRSATHLMKQGEKSVRPGGRCLYAGPRGLACAVGCLMTPEQAKEADRRELSAEHVVQNQMLDGDALVAAEAAGFWARSLLVRLQVVHDDAPP